MVFPLRIKMQLDISPLPLAGEGGGEGGYNFYPLTAALRHPVFPNSCTAVRDSFLSPGGRGSIKKKPLHKINEEAFINSIENPHVVIPPT